MISSWLQRFFVAGGDEQRGLFRLWILFANMTGTVSMIADNVSIWHLHLVAAFRQSL